jgi:hypothetical protein
MRDSIFFLRLLSHLGPGSGKGRTTSGERLSLLVPEISRATGVLVEGTGISCLRSSFYIGVRDDGPKSSSPKASLENGQIPGLAKVYILLFAVKEVGYASFVNDARSWIVITLSGLA